MGERSRRQFSGFQSDRQQTRGYLRRSADYPGPAADLLIASPLFLQCFLPPGLRLEISVRADPAKILPSISLGTARKPQPTWPCSLPARDGSPARRKGGSMTFANFY